MRLEGFEEECCAHRVGSSEDCDKSLIHPSVVVPSRVVCLEAAKLPGSVMSSFVVCCSL